MLNAFLSLPLVLLFTIFASRVDSQFISAQNFLPVSYPLAVRSPYLNAWIDTPDRTTSLNVWPTHWDNNNIMGWTGFARIDGVAWQWMGEGGPGNTTTVLTSEITPTQSRFSVLAGSVVLNITFFSPIEPSDLVKQSFPFIYLSVEATSIDGNEHDVQLYSDITAEWISGDRTKVAVWQTVVSSTDVYHQASLQNPEPMTEITNIAEDSTVYYSMQTVSKMTYQSGISGTMRSQFGSTGSLSDTQDNTFQAINAGGFIAFAFAVDLGSSTSFTTPTVWALGIVRDPVIQYVPQAGSSQSQNRRSYFWTQFSSIGNAISAFLSDYTDAVQRATALEQRITSAAQSISTDLADLVSFGARQALTSDITISQDSNGAWNYSDVLAFQRDTGKSRRVNAVETLYATMPIHLYLNASWLGMHLQPLLQYQDSSGYQNAFASPDLGPSYPSAPGDSSNTVAQSLETTGNMLIMTWAHARMSGDGTLIKRYYDLLKRWTNFLVTNSLLQNNQISADGLQNVNMTNLAIKGILGVAAMAQISSATGEDADAQAFKANASALYQTWKSLALSSSNSGHLLPTYGNTAASGYALMYNMYPDNLLGLGVIEESVYEAQAAYYSTLAQSAGQFGLTFDTSSNGEANSAWTLFTAGSIANSSTSTRNELVSMVYARANSNASTSVGSFPTYYNDTTGASPTPGGGQASPGQGAMFALLALNLATPSISFPATLAKHSLKTSTIAGAAVGGAIFILLGLGLLVFFLRRRRREQKAEKHVSLELSESAYTDNFVPQPYDWRSSGTIVPLRPGPGTMSDSRSTSERDSLRKSRHGIGMGPVASAPESQAGSSDLSPNSDSTQMFETVEALRREVERLREVLPGPPPPEYEQLMNAG